MVYKLHTITGDNRVLTKEYRYQNGIQHLSGKGFLGFQKTFSSDTYESVLSSAGKYRMKDVLHGVFWTVNTYKPELENTLISSTYGSLDPNSVFTRTENTSQRFDKGNNRYLILSTSEQTTDYLKQIYVSKSYEYDSANDLLLKQATTNYNGESSEVNKFFYKPEFTNDDHYFFGKIERTENTSLSNGDVFTTKDEQFYNAIGALVQTKKYGHLTPEPISTTYSYYTYGEVQTQSLFATSTTDPLTTSYEYDATKRYLYKVTTPDQLVTTTNVDYMGRLLSEVSPLGIETFYKYDRWNNVKEITDFLGKKTTIQKLVDPTVSKGVYSISTKREGGVETIATFDEFDRQIQIKTQSINGKWTISDTEFDLFGKKIRYSEPYFNGESPFGTPLNMTI